MTSQELQERIDIKPISNNIRKIGYEHKVLWKDGDKVIETWTESRTIDVASLRKDIAWLEDQIATLPDFIEMPTEKEALRTTLEQKKDELASYGFNN